MDLFARPHQAVPTLAVIIFLYCVAGTWLFWIAVVAAILLLLAGLS